MGTAIYENFDAVTAPDWPSLLAIQTGSFVTDDGYLSDTSPNAGRLGTDGVFWSADAAASGEGQRQMGWFVFRSINQYTGLFFFIRLTGATFDTDDQAYVVQIKQGSSDTFIGIQLWKKEAGNSYSALSGVVPFVAQVDNPYRIFIDIVPGVDDNPLIRVRVNDGGGAANPTILSDWLDTDGTFSFSASAIAIEYQTDPVDFPIIYGDGTQCGVQMYDFPANQAVYVDTLVYYDILYDPPTDVTFTPDDDTSGHLTYGASTGYSLIYQSTTGEFGTYSQVGDDPNIDNDQHFSSLSPGVTYWWKVKTTDNDKEFFSDFSDAASYTVPASGIPRQSFMHLARMRGM